MDVGYRCNGGPLHLKRLNLECPKSGTLTFTLNGMTGRYVYKTHEQYAIAIGSYFKWVS